MKMAVPIRTLVITAVIMFTYLWVVVGFIGSYQLNNNIAMNATLKGEYEAVIGNSSNPGVFGTLGNLTTQGKNQGQSLGGLNTLNSVGMVAQFLGSIPAMYSAVAQLTVGQLTSTLGISLNVIQTNILFLAVIIIVLAILSAIFLFPI